MIAGARPADPGAHEDVVIVTVHAHLVVTATRKPPVCVISVADRVGDTTMKKIITVFAALTFVLAAAACGSSLSSPTAADRSATRYSSAQEVVGALDRAGLRCSGGSYLTPVVHGASSETLCNFSSSQTGLIDVFPGAVTTATVLRNSVSTGTQKIWSDVGPNWWIQTTSAYVRRVQKILGGKIIGGPWHPQAAASSAPAVTAPSSPAASTCDSQVSTWLQSAGTSQDQTAVNDIDALRTAISNATSALDPGIVSAASTLSADATSAAKNSPPKCSGLYYKYLLAMAALSLGGTDVRYGSDTNGTALLTKGINELTPVLTQINNMAGVS